MKNGMRLRKLKEKIMTKEPTTFSEMMAMATKLIKMDEDRRLRCEDDKAPLKNEERTNLGDLDLNVPILEARQEAQPTDSEERLKITHL